MKCHICLTVFKSLIQNRRNIIQYFIFLSFEREMFLHGPSFNGNHRMFKIFFKVKVQVEFNYMYMHFPLTLKKFLHLSDDVI